MGNSQDNGKQIVLLMDCNEDVRSSTTHSWLQDHALTDVILTKHGKDNAPVTYTCRSKPIDGIFVLLLFLFKHMAIFPLVNSCQITGLYGWMLLITFLATTFQDVFNLQQGNFNVTILK